MRSVSSLLDADLVVWLRFLAVVRRESSLVGFIAYRQNNVSRAKKDFEFLKLGHICASGKRGQAVGKAF